MIADQPLRYGDAKSKRPGWYRNKISRKNATKGQKRALRDLYPKWGVTVGYGEVVDKAFLSGVFGREADVVLDIGFGTGEALVEMAGNDLGRDWLGVDWHTPGVGKCLLAIEESGLTNVRVASKDAMAFLRQNVRSRLFSAVNIYFPDPWDRQPSPDKVNLRLINPTTAYHLARTTTPSSTVHIATDVIDYVPPTTEYLTRVGFSGGVIPRPEYRPVTPYETKGIEAGRVVTDMMFYSPEEVVEICGEEEEVVADEDGGSEDEEEYGLFDEES